MMEIHIGCGGSSFIVYRIGDENVDAIWQYQDPFKNSKEALYVRRLERDFLEEGGLRERMTRARLAAPAGQNR